MTATSTITSNLTEIGTAQPQLVLSRKIGKVTMTMEHGNVLSCLVVSWNYGVAHEANKFWVKKVLVEKKFG